MSSTFGCFSTARLGIYAAQKGLDVTGNNITNINTPGYTRQRLDQVSLVTTASDKYFSQYNTRVGQGVLTTGVSQLRDPGLDLLYRGAQANVGSYGQMLSGLDDIASILDEVGKGSNDQDDGVILNQLNDLRDLINQAVTNGIDGSDRLIYSSAKSLCLLFNKAAKDLEDLKGTYESYLEEDVSRVNTILSNIQELNVSIRNADIRGDDALELRDERNRLLDELSGYMKIDVKYTMEDVGAGLMVEKLTVSLANDDPTHQYTLVEGEYATQLSQTLLRRNLNFDPSAPIEGNNLPYWDAWGSPVLDPEKAAVLANDNYSIVFGPLTDLDGEKKSNADFGVDLGDNDLYGSIQSLREILTEEGEYATNTDIANDPNAAIKRGIPYYQNALDSLAKEFAEVFNQTNQLPFDQVQDAYKLDDTSKLFVDAAGNKIQGIDADGHMVDMGPGFFNESDVIKGLKNHYNTLGTPLSDEEAKQMAQDLMSKNLEILRQQGVLTKAYESYTGGPLFSNSSNGNDTSNITAANIAVSKDWASGVVSMVSSMKPGESTGDTSNLAAFLDLFSKKHSFDPTDIDSNATGTVYNGSFEDMLLRIESTLAEDQMTVGNIYNNYTITSNEIYTDRDSVSGVDLNDEATNLMVYQKAYTAACRLMTTLEEALDSLLAM